MLLVTVRLEIDTYLDREATAQYIADRMMGFDTRVSGVAVKVAQVGSAGTNIATRGDIEMDGYTYRSDDASHP